MSDCEGNSILKKPSVPPVSPQQHSGYSCFLSGNSFPTTVIIKKKACQGDMQRTCLAFLYNRKKSLICNAQLHDNGNSTSPSYSGDPGFKSRTADRLFLGSSGFIQSLQANTEAQS
jgi:hypothetical protein